MPRFFHNGVRYDLPDEWWAEAGMTNFAPTRRSYVAGPSEFPDLPVFEAAIRDVAPLIRPGSHGVFNDAGPGRREGTARERVLRILGWFRNHTPVEPVCLAPLPSGSGHEFELVHGAHRFYCAVASGFSHVAAVRVVNTWR
jgi:hypothetical protein